VDKPEVEESDADELEADVPDVDVSSSIVAAVFSKVDRHCWCWQTTYFHIRLGLGMLQLWEYQPYFA
jgi:hypothetical protein